MATTAAVSSGSRFCRDCGGPVTNREELAWCVNTVPKASAERYRLGPGFFAEQRFSVTLRSEARLAAPLRRTCYAVVQVVERPGAPPVIRCRGAGVETPMDADLLGVRVQVVRDGLVQELEAQVQDGA